MPLALITGASRGIGAATARALADSHTLLLGGRDRGALAALAAELPDARPWPVELTDPSALAAATSDLSEVDVLVHSAGIARVGPLEDASAARWREMYEVNVIAAVELTRLLLPALRATGGHVVLVNSGAGRNANPGWGPYAASKFALRAYADVLRGEEPGIRVTSVFPGRTDTAMQRTVREDEGGAYEAERYLRPESVAAAIRTAVLATAEAHLTEVVIRSR
ncbi:SDR family oxidoreductase [Actinokineospora diospyrosa]|uniref:NADP-dependent 3-hydroxy acid dehydrogenase YdfG n=1 Tax=Actinokineospora diospyrosa TaxID=103728 RepID=A0ABT1IDC2_9PSEU|nr:SDR family oxidoreductase [Actinokineospora diospyrosa]MCP2270346.1 NADP-dependent 3-hydroxy acid dehydrogenase YdfG [Actinokineospora diospyrosa]